jgi:ABC-type phosphate transport system permease subunit
VEKGALMYAGLVLLGITLAINILGTLLVMRTAKVGEAKR